MSWLRRLALLNAVLLPACSSVVATPSPAHGQAPEQSDDPLMSLLERVELREIGPAIMGGRITDLAVDESDPATFYVGFATGGLWKTTSDGASWEPVFDDQPTSSIGDVTLAPSNPNVVWVGTGEPQNRQSSPYGNGVYRSTDGGRTWVHLGLEDTKHIGRIAVHPGDPDVAYVAAVGHLWGPNEERGVYKTTDGGESWSKVLYVDEHTGAIDLVMDPGDPSTLFAAMYQRRRTGFGFSANGGGSGIYRTVDGGASWAELTHGLPTEEKGRIGLDIFRGDTNVLYATVQSTGEAGFGFGGGQPQGPGGLFRSTDRGESWQRVSTRNPRPMYFSLVRIDPGNPERIYLGGVQLSISDDGGKTWWEGDAAEGIHVDHHALWIHPKDSDHVILGSDGGLSISRDGGVTWRMVNNMAVGQFYEIGYDMREPYHVCGGLQDNSSWCAPNQTLNVYGVHNYDWKDVSGGDGFYNRVDPNDFNIIYTESQGGNISRMDLRTGESQAIRPVARPAEDDEDRSYSFNWDSPIAISHHDSRTVFIGADYLMRSRDRGVTWEEASPDLTKQIDPDTLAVMGTRVEDVTISQYERPSTYGNITAISESPLSASVIYVGTDDGNLQVTTDGGVTWTNVVANVPGVPERTYVSRLDASHHVEGRVYAAFDGHRNDDYAAYVFVSEDYGQSWRSIVSGLPEHSVNVVREHPRTPGLLFLGNEVGAFVSIDRGGSWSRIAGNFPTVPVDDMHVHPREDDLIIGTHGRSIWILHDLGALRHLAEGAAAMAGGLLYPTKDATMWSRSGGWPFWGEAFIAENPEDGVHLRYHLPAGLETTAHDRELASREAEGGDETSEMPGDEDVMQEHHGPKLVIRDAEGETVRELEIDAEAGFGQVVWNFRLAAEEEDSESGGGGFFGPPRGPRVLPGSYTAHLALGESELTTGFAIRLDPRIEVSAADLMQRQEALLTLRDMAAPIREGRQAVRRLGDQLRDVKTLIEEAEVPEDLVVEVDSLQARVDSIGGDLQGISTSRLAFGIDGSTTRPTADQLWQIEDAWRQMEEALGLLNEVIGMEMPALYERLNELGVRPDPGDAIEIPRRSGG
jgi:photosystem II stability/assembly factor-like uncharacterized protein